MSIDTLLGRLRDRHDDADLGAVFMHFRDRLWRMLHVRIDGRLAGRLSPDDVIQEAFIDVQKRLREFFAQEAVTFYVWLRFLTLQRLQILQRAHLGAKMRDARMEVSLTAASPVFASAESMAGQFAGDLTSPSKAAMRNELIGRLRDALDGMDPLDREVLALRHFEELDNVEAAAILGISREAAGKRHVRALKRLKEILVAAGELSP